MNAFVTGCAGFIGSHICENLLSRGFEVVGVDSFTNYYDPKIKERNISNFLNHDKFSLIRCDITELREFPEVEFVFHQAAQAGVRASWGDRFEDYVHANIITTQRLLEFYKDIPIKKFVYASSSSVYGDCLLPATENTVPHPISPYGVTKLAAEHLCYLYYRNYSLPTVSLRYFTVYGPRQRPDMAINIFLTKMMNNEILPIYGDGSQMRDFTYISDIVEANISAAYRGIPGAVYNIAGGSMISLLDLIKLIETKSGFTAKIDITSRQKGDVQDTWGNIESAKKELHWEPIITIDRGIQSYCDWRMKNN